MEHRHAARSPVTIKAVAEFSTGSRREACIRNISLGGIYIELPTSQLSVHAPVLLHFSLDENAGSKNCQWRGFLTRLEKNGAGAMFESADPAEQGTLLALLDLANNQPGTTGS